MKLQLERAFQRARQSRFQLWWLNRLLWMGIPFNAPHRLRIASLADEEVVIEIPFRRANKNHLGSLHACAMATAAEYSSGLVLLQQAGSATYRLIMQRIEADYHAQGRMAAKASAHLSAEEVQEKITGPLEAGAESVVYRSKAEVHDHEDRHLCTVTIYWQIKRWDKVRSSRPSS